MTDIHLVRSSEESIKDHIRTYHQALKSGQLVSLSSFFPSYIRLGPSLHQKLNSKELDFPALGYSLPRLPECLFNTENIYIAQNWQKFEDLKLNLAEFVPVDAPARRRSWLFNESSKTLLCLISSDSDLDDLVNTLICFSLEWQKIKALPVRDLADLIKKESYKKLGINEDEWSRLKNFLGDNWSQKLSSHLFDFNLQLIGYDGSDYLVGPQSWWQQVSDKSLILGLSTLPIYFVSSNLHSLSNVIGGFVKHEQGRFFSYIEESNLELYDIWQKIKSGENDIRVNDFLYYISGIFSNIHPDFQREKILYESKLGIKNLQPKSSFFSEAQIIPVSAIANSLYLDGNLNIKNKEKLSQSKSVIINIDYPLGFAAYYLLSALFGNLSNLRGVYIIGKAAILSGAIGDIQIPKSVFDERSGNIFHLNNIFNNQFPFVGNQSEILQNQKAICVFGTFLENAKQLNGYIESGFNIIEMESGAYLTAIAETILHKNLPQNEVIDVDNLPFDFGIINYASDNPLTKNLGEGNLALRGVEPTYLALLSVVQRIIDLEG
jgi:hypothetical protein